MIGRERKRERERAREGARASEREDEREREMLLPFHKCPSGPLYSVNLFEDLSKCHEN